MKLLPRVVRRSFFTLLHKTVNLLVIFAFMLQPFGATGFNVKVLASEGDVTTVEPTVVAPAETLAPKEEKVAPVVEEKVVTPPKVEVIPAETPVVTPKVEAIAPVETPVVAPKAEEVAPVVTPTETAVTSPETPGDTATVVTPTPTETTVTTEVTPTAETIVPTSAEVPVVAPVITNTPVVVETWGATIGNKVTTNAPVVVGTTYVAPQNKEVTVTFTKLPEKVGTLSIEEITLTPEQVKTLGALSNKAYDITSDMADGTFTYDLTLPKPVNQENVQIKFAEDVAGLKNADTVATSDVTTQTNSVSAALDHFTTFVVTKNPNPDCAGNVYAAGVCYATIQAAVNAATGGETISIAAGTYAENVEIFNKSNLTILGVGQGDDGTIIAGNGTGIAIKTSSGITIKNLKIHTVGANKPGIWVYGWTVGGSTASNNLTVQDTTIVTEGYSPGIVGDSVKTTAHSGWLIGGEGHSNTIQIKNSGDGLTDAGDGIDLQDVTNSEVSYNNITIPTTSTGSTNVLWSSEAAPLTNLVFKNNVVSGSAGSEVSILTDYNTINPSAEDPAVIGSIGTVQIQGNTFSNWGTKAINVGKANQTGTVTGITINSNTFQMTKDTTLVIGGTSASIATGSGNTFNVSGTAKIQKAVNAALAGDTINVANGTYDLTSRIDVNKAVSIIGNTTTPANVVINAPLAGGTQHGQNSVFMITSKDVTIKGFRIQGALHTGAAQNAGIYVDDPRLVTHPGLSNIIISNNEVTDNGYGIFVHNIKNSTISNNKVYGNKSTATSGMEYDAGTGIVVYGRAQDANHTYNLTIDNNQVYSNETDGIRVDVSSSVGASDWVNDLAITISKNTVYNNGRIISGIDKYIGIKSSGMSKGVTVSGNEIYGHAMSTHPTADNQSSGIWISPNNDWKILDNNIHDNTNGVVFVYSTAVPGSGSHTISNNNIHANVRGISIDDGTEAVANNKNSIYSNNSTAFSGIGFAPYNVYNSGSGTFDVTNNWWGSAVLATIQSKVDALAKVTVDPYYVNTGKTILNTAAPTSVYVSGAYTDGSANGHIFGYDAFTTIQNGIAAVATGGTVNVVAGTYDVTQIIINKKLILQGAGASVTTIDGGDYVIPSASGSEPGTIFIKDTDSSSPVTIDGFTFKNPAVWTDGGNEIVSIAASANKALVTISHNHFIGESVNNTQGLYDNAIWMYWPQGAGTISITNNEFEHSWQPILVELPNPGVTITGNNFHDLFMSDGDPSQALSLWAYGGFDVTNPIVVSSNTFTNSDGWSIVLRGGGASIDGTANAQFKNVVIQNNNITSTGANSAGIVLRNPASTLSDAALDGIVGATISGNTITSSVAGQGKGIWLRGPNNNPTITGNSITGYLKGILSESYNVDATSTGVDASENWWGSSVLADIQAKVSGLADLDFTPWFVNSGMTILSNAVTGDSVTPLGSADLILSSDIVGGVDLPAGVTDVVLDNDSGLNLFAGLVDNAVTVQSGIDGAPIVLTNSDLSGVSASIPDGTKIQGPTDWNGIIDAPHAVTSAGTAPSGFAVGNSIIEIGSSDGVLYFDQAVKITLPGVTGTVAYKPAGSDVWTEITTQCNSATDHSNISSDECYFTDGADTIIWTYHFTSFGGLTDTQAPDNISSLDANYQLAPNRVQLTWNVKDSDIDMVYIYQGKSKNFSVNTSTRIAKNSRNDTNFSDYNVTPGEKYYYKVVAVDAAGNKSSATIISVALPTEGTAAVVKNEGTEVLPAGTVLGAETTNPSDTVTTTPSDTQTSGKTTTIDKSQNGKVLGADTKNTNGDNGGLALWQWLLFIFLLGGAGYYGVSYFRKNRNPLS